MVFVTKNYNTLLLHFLFSYIKWKKEKKEIFIKSIDIYAEKKNKYRSIQYLSPLWKTQQKLENYKNNKNIKIHFRSSLSFNKKIANVQFIIKDTRNFSACLAYISSKSREIAS